MEHSLPERSPLRIGIMRFTTDGLFFRKFRGFGQAVFYFPFSILWSN